MITWNIVEHIVPPDREKFMADTCICDESNDPRIIAVTIIENSPSIAIRVTGENGRWITKFITKNIAKYGYNHEDFTSGRISWEQIVYPEDLPGLIASLDDYEKRGIDVYNNIYRILTADGKPVWIADDSTVIRDADGNVLYSDCIIADYTETKRHIEMIEDHYRQQRVLKEILLGLHDSDSDKAVQIILDSTGVYLDISRVILFEDSPDHSTCRAIYEWTNTGISSMGDLVIDYKRDIPEIYDDLHKKGSRIVNYGDIPVDSTREFDSEGVVAAAIFAVYVDNAYFGFICFDECVKERTWPEDQIRFLQNIAKLVSPAIMRKRTGHQAGGGC